MDSVAETELAAYAGEFPIDSELVMLDGEPTIVLSFQIRNLPKSSDLNSDGFVDLHDALLSLALFNTPVQPTSPQPVPPGQTAAARSSTTRRTSRTPPRC